MCCLWPFHTSNSLMGLKTGRSFTRFLSEMRYGRLGFARNELLW